MCVCVCVCVCMCMCMYVCVCMCMCVCVCVCMCVCVCVWMCVCVCMYVCVMVNIFSIFIAWLNLDLGIQTCFYDGMDAYTKTWLQFVFPVYIWVIAGLIIHFSRRYSVVAKMIGKNAVKVLATLFLLSYAKLLRTIILAVSPALLTHITTNGSYEQNVWLYDGNVHYIQGKHTPLFLVALAFGLFSLPYTLSLLFVQHLQRLPHLCMFRWVGRLKPLFDAYAGPYKDRYRFWTGLLLLVRLILYSTFALNVFGEPTLNLLTISLACLSLLALGHRVYKKWPLDLLEIFFLLNLGALSTATAYTQSIGGDQAAATYTSVSIALALFILVLSYHFHKEILSGFQGWRELMSHFPRNYDPN